MSSTPPPPPPGDPYEPPPNGGFGPPPGIPQPPQPPPYPIAGQPPPANPYAVTYPENSQAVTVLVLGLMGLVFCGVLAPVAWIMGNTEVAAIDAGRRSPDNRGLAVAGRILGIIGTVLIALIVGFLFLFVVLGVASSA